MANPDLSKWLASTTLSELRSLIAAKEKLDHLLHRKAGLERELASVDTQIISLRRSLEISSVKGVPTGVRKTTPGRLPARSIQKMRKGERPSRPSIQSLIVEAFQEKKRKTLSVNEIADFLLNEKNYKTTSTNFKNQLRVLLYRNDKGIFRKIGHGKFGLAGPLPTPGIGKTGSAKKPASATKKATIKKRPGPGKKVASGKSASRRKAEPRKKSGRRPAGKPPAASAIEPLIVEIMKEKKKPLSLYEITGALLNEKKVLTSSTTFDEQVRSLLNNPQGSFRSIKAGQFGLA